MGVIFAKRSDGSAKAVISSFSTHPNSMEGESYYSADVPGAVRQVLRAVLGEGTSVLYLTGAAGNTAPSVMENNPKSVQPWRGEAGWRRSGQYLGAEILKTMAASVAPMEAPALRLAQGTLPVPIRPWPDDFTPGKWEPSSWANYYVRSHQAWPRMLKEESPVPVHLNVLRLGDAAVCTNPAEFFVELGLAIKKDSPARVTLISQLTDGYCGYVPTRDAFRRGGYCTMPAPSSKLAEDAGDRMVAETRRLLGQAFGT